MTFRLRRLLWPKSWGGKAILFLVFMTALLVSTFFSAQHYSAKRLAEAWKLGDEFGLPIELSALLGERVPDAENAAFPLDEASTIAGRFLTVERERHKNPEDRALIQNQTYLAAMDRLLSDAEYERAISEADRRTGYFSPIVPADPLINTKLTHLEPRRELIRAEQAIARRLASLGKREEAVERLLRIARLTRRWEDREPFFVAALVNISLRSVLIAEFNFQLRNGGPLPSRFHNDIDREMSETERLLLVIPRLAQVEKLSTVGAFDQFAVFRPRFLTKPIADADRAFLLHHIHWWARTYDRPHYLVKSGIDAKEAELQAMFEQPLSTFMYQGTRLLMPAFKMVRIGFDRLIANARCLRIVNAMARKSDFAAEISTLGAPKECLVDPFDGNRLRIKTTPAGPIIYSVGSDFADDGGSIGNGKDAGLGPREPKAEN